MNEVERIYQNKGVLMHNIYVYSKSIAIEFIEECRKNRIEILGIDAFLITADHHQPSLDNSIDLGTSNKSSNKFSKNNWEIAIEFLNSREDKYYFEIVI